MKKISNERFKLSNNNTSQQLFGFYPVIRLCCKCSVSISSFNSLIIPVRRTCASYLSAVSQLWGHPILCALMRVLGICVFLTLLHLLAFCLGSATWRPFIPQILWGIPASWGYYSHFPSALLAYWFFSSPITEWPISNVRFPKWNTQSGFCWL